MKSAEDEGNGKDEYALHFLSIVLGRDETGQCPDSSLTLHRPPAILSDSGRGDILLHVCKYFCTSAKVKYLTNY